MISILEEATRTFVTDARYTNNEKYLKLWIAYADAMKDSGDIFKYLYSNKIGEDLALFYLAWAYVTERAGNYAFADKIYIKGIHR